MEAVCGSASGATRPNIPASSELCSLGNASEVTTTSTGWNWTCTLGSSVKSCSATKLVEVKNYNIYWEDTSAG